MDVLEANFPGRIPRKRKQWSSHQDVHDKDVQSPEAGLAPERTAESINCEGKQAHG